MQYLDRDRALEHEVTRTEHICHAPRADALQQLVTIVEYCTFFHNFGDYTPSLPPPNTNEEIE